MKRTKIGMTAGAAAVTGILLVSCGGESAKEKAAPAPAVAVPAPDTVVHRAIFKSAVSQEWLKSETSWREERFSDPDLAWEKTVGNTYKIVEAGCMDDKDDAVPCHLEVHIDAAGNSVPERTFGVQQGSSPKTYNIEVFTPGDNTQFMSCKDVAEDPKNDQFISGECSISDPPVPPEPKHNFCAHTRKVFGKLTIYYRFTHRDCSLSSLNVHNGNGHTE